MTDNPRLPIFEQWAGRYDRSVQTDTGIFASYDEILAEVVRAAGVKAGMRVLELGVGTGNLAQRFVALGCEVWGVDFSPAMLAIAREKAPEARLASMDLTGEWSPILDQHFDRIVANFVLHEFDLPTKVAMLERLVRQHLLTDGLIVVGDIAFPTAQARGNSGAESWDEDESYWAADETMAACTGTGLEAIFKPVSWCTGVFVVKPSSIISSGSP